MKSIFWSGKANYIYLLFIILALGACKKSKVTPEPDPVPPSSGPNTKQTPTTNRTQLTNDSLFLYAKQVYFWNDALPSYDDFTPRNYGSDFENELFAITRFKVDPTTSRPYEYRASDPGSPKYSYIDDVANRNPVAVVAKEQARVNLEGDGNDVGILAVRAIKNTSTSPDYKLFILAVDKGSPADVEGLTRGAYITNINGVSIGSVANFQTEKNTFDPAIYGDPSSIRINGFKIDGTPFSTTLTKKSYKSNPIFKTNVLTVGAKKIGYLAYARFSSEENSEAVLDAAFRDFVSQSVTDLVIDLRYNGGGYVDMAEHLVNLIAPSTATGVMYKEYYNSTMQNRQATILKNQPLLDANDKVRYASNGRMLNYFDDIDYTLARNTYSFGKVGALTGVTNIVFIVSGNTASASELVINSLKPKMNVKLVGLQTYGKPVGFFPIRIQNKYDVFYSMFETKNSLDQGGYYSGMTPNVILDEDYGDRDFGDPAEALLAASIDVLVPKAATTGVVSRNRVMSTSAETLGSGNKSPLGGANKVNGFVGMIETRKQK
ncbi:S41 family peptidase [Pedobacter nyackensis]|uniref:S41 family peptidase n=1 Tax=Pedobacter nyackensis TaxID=475255 RepID=UPI00293037FB|nr:S41 family peptidase [Pedobacter nyackensis]